MGVNNLARTVIYSGFTVLIFFIIGFLFMDFVLRFFPNTFLKFNFIKPVPFLISYDEHVDYLYKKKLNVSLEYSDVIESNYITDSLGFRNQKVLQSIDLALIGDSFASSEGVPQKEMWSNLVSKTTGLQIMNFGVLGFGPQQEFETLKYYSLPLKPKKVIWIISQNDIYNANFYLKPTSNFLEKILFLNSPLLSLLKSTYQFYFNSSNKRLNNPLKLRVSAESEVLFFPDYEGYIYNWSEKEITNSKGWMESSQIYLKAKKLCDENKISITFVFIPGKELIYFDKLSKKTKTSFLENGKNLPILLSQFFEKNKLSYFDSTEFLRNNSGDKNLFYSIDGHFNVFGNKVFSKFVSKNIVNQSSTSTLESGLSP